MRRRLLILALLAVVLIPTTAFAVEWLPVVQCGTTGQPPCTPCYMFKTGKNLIDLILYGVTGPLAAFMFVLAGGMMLVGADSVKLQAQARSLFTNTVYGVTIVFTAWLGTNFLIKSIGGGSVGDTWAQFTCPAFLASINSGTDVPTAVEPVTEQPASVKIAIGDLTTTDLQKLAQENGTLYPAQNSGDLNTLIECLYQDPIIKALTYPKPANQGRQTGNFTYENDNEYCNYTRGLGMLGGGKCAHAQNSCHYGGPDGKGAMAIDLNALGNDKLVTLPGVIDSTTKKAAQVYATEDQLFCQLNRVLVTEHKCSFGLLNWEPTSTGGHTHVSTKSCKADGDGVATFRNATLPNCSDSARYPKPATSSTSTTGGTTTQ